MFRIITLVDDKHLPALLRALAGITRGAPEVVPVVNATTHKGVVRSRTDGPTYEILLNHFREKKMHEFSGPDAKSALKELGMSHSSYSHYLANAVRDGKLKKLKMRKGAGTPPHTHFSLVALREDKP